jgi:bacteriocin-like protein
MNKNKESDITLELTEDELNQVSGGKGGGEPNVYMEVKLKEVFISAVVTSPTNPT